ncbi:hypothetical protein [Blastococcus sp. MG754426]|nr:hypothetical protein [Blastococcus sp. MG754426]
MTAPPADEGDEDADEDADGDEAGEDEVAVSPREGDEASPAARL